MKRWAWVLWVVIACGDDGGSTATSVATMTAGSTGEATGSSTDASEGSEGSTGAGESSSGSGGATTSSGSSSDGGSSTTGVAGDPSYPPLEGGACPGGEVPTQLPGGSLCAPFCTGDAAMCPDAATGDAVPTCTPFERDGSGSGDPCETHDTCPMGEACGIDGTCIAVAFWACQLRCDGGEVCPDAMACTSIGACGYP